MLRLRERGRPGSSPSRFLVLRNVTFESGYMSGTVPEDNLILTGRSTQVEDLVQKLEAASVGFPESFVRPSRIHPSC
jgi:hypothetical protein